MAAKTSPTASEPDIFDALLALKTRAEAEAFCADLFTPGEVKAFAERWHVARLLDEGRLSYREIAEKAGSSTATVVRVARFLKDMPYRGYRVVLDRLKRSRKNAA
ncbi:MAG: YerC/YecD family TrpR-related protein [Parvularculaceae bacterium]|nr:YerC/YecD family TrpR-related protein [Parvularculaceae bacterium]